MRFTQRFLLAVVIGAMAFATFTHGSPAAVPPSPLYDGIIRTFAGGGPDNMPALDASIDGPAGLAFDQLGNLYIATVDMGIGSRVYRVDGNQRLSIAAGNGAWFGALFFREGIENVAARDAQLYMPASVAFDRVGNLFISDNGLHCVRRVDATTGLVRTVAGNCGRIYGYTGDGGPARSARLFAPKGIAFDAAGNLYIADYGNYVIRRVSPGADPASDDLITGEADEIVTTIAGNGTAPGSIDGEGNVATDDLHDGPNPLAASLSAASLAIDLNGDLLFSDLLAHRIRRIASGTGPISTVAGTGQTGLSGGGVPVDGPALNSPLRYPGALAVDKGNNLFLQSAGRVLRIDASTGDMTTFAGGGNKVAADDDAATAVSLRFNHAGMAFDSLGRLCISTGYQRVLRIESGKIKFVAGSGKILRPGDGGPASNAALALPRDVTFDSNWNLFIADINANTVRRVDAASGTISTVAGTGTGGKGADGIPATDSALSRPEGLAADASGNLYIAEMGNHRVRRVDANGVVTTVAGSGIAGFSGDGGPAAAAQLNAPMDVAVDASGQILYIADTWNNRIRRVDLTAGTIGSVAGSGPSGFFSTGNLAGDGGQAASALLANPESVVADQDGHLFIADTFNARVRRVDAVSGVITTVAGGGTSTTGRPAVEAMLSVPRGLALDSQGNLFVSEKGRVERVTRVSAGPDGKITGDDKDEIIDRIVAGCCFLGDGGPASVARIFTTDGLAVDAFGTVYLADSSNHRVRRIPVSLAGALQELRDRVINSTTLPGALVASLPGRLQDAIDAIAAGDIAKARGLLRGMINEIQPQLNGPQLTETQRKELESLLSELQRLLKSL